MKLDKMKKEMIEVGLITLYFFACFSLFMIIKKLLLFQYHISFYGWASALVGALAIGKVVFIIDKLPIHNWLTKLKPINGILFKALVYTGLVVLVSILEKSIHFWIENPVLESWQSHLFGDGKGAGLLAHTIYIYSCFIVFFFVHFLDEHFGKKEILDLLTKSE
ncbi:MAG: hypothetical protein JXR07_07485 [Reichenbachiella sp.]